MRRDQSVTTRRRAAVVGTGFQRHVGRGAFDGFTASLRIAQGHDFGMRAPGLLGVALSDHLTVGRGEDAAYAGVGVGQAQ
jgi:hypothetical protein